MPNIRHRLAALALRLMPSNAQCASPEGETIDVVMKTVLYVIFGNAKPRTAGSQMRADSTWHQRL